MRTMTVCRTKKDAKVIVLTESVNFDGKLGILVSAADCSPVFVEPSKRSELVEHRDALERYCRIQRLVSPFTEVS